MASLPSAVTGAIRAGRRSEHETIRSWRLVVSLVAVAGGVATIIGCLLPWASIFAGLISFRGISAQNGRMLAGVGAVIVIAGLWHLIRGGATSRWVAGLGGFAAAGLAGFLLLRLAGELRSMGSDSMVILRGGPGLWVAGAGGLLALCTLLMPPSAQQSLRSRPGGLLAWAADRESAGRRRALQIGLGLVWVLDAALQYQPFMFGRGFVTHVIEPAAMGSPAALSSSIMSIGHGMLHYVVAANATFATIQLLIGLGLLCRATARAALAATIVWGLAVWYLGESLGGLLSGSASPLTGAPGAALLYVLLALLLWPRPAGRSSVAAASMLGTRWSRLAWVMLWGGLAALLFQPQVRAAGAVRAAVRGLASGEPSWLASMDRAVAGAIGPDSIVPVLIVAAVFMLIALGVLIPRLTRPALMLAVLAAVAIWVIGENFGGILTGTGTDPNTGPLLILLAAAYWPASAPRRAGGPGPKAASEVPTVTGPAHYAGVG